VALSDDLERIAGVAATFAAPGERVAGILVAEPLGTGRIYLCAYESAAGHAWLAFDAAGATVTDRHAVREAASLSGLCEIAEESAGGGDLPELIARLAEIRRREAPEGIEDAEEAAKALEATVEPPPRLATTAYLDRLGAASRRLEQALGDGTGSPFAAAMQQALPAVEELAAGIERAYKGPLA
jgi:hypothetical protein